MATRSKTVRHLMQPPVVGRILLLEHVVEERSQPVDLLAEWVHRTELRFWSVVYQSVKGGGSLNECVVDHAFHAVNLGSTNSG